MAESNKRRREQNEQTARARAAAMRIEQQRAERRRRLMTIGGVSLGLLAVVGAIIGFAVTGGSSSTTTGLRKALPVADVQDIAAASKTPPSADATPPTGLLSEGVPQKISDPALTANGKPDILYIGAEFCPYCAAERWALTVALDRFGKLSGLETMHSSPSDTDPNTPTVTFLHASYASNSISFSSVEDEDINHKALQKPTSAQETLWKKYTYDPSTGSLGFPFIDFGGKAISVGPLVDPSILAGLTQHQVSVDLSNPSSAVGKALNSAADYFTAGICLATGNQPSSVCTAAVQALEQKLPAYKPVASSSAGSTAGG